MSVAFLIPTTSRNTNWTNLLDSYLYNIFLPSIKNLHDTTLYIGYDCDDPIFDNAKNQRTLENLYPQVHFKWFGYQGYSGNPVAIWNKLGKEAFDDGIAYMKVIGDDIKANPLMDNWLDVMIHELKKRKNVGWVAGYSGNNTIPTQFLVHRTHFEIFKFIYPPELKNWFCDNWLCLVYPKQYRCWITDIHLYNMGGKPRYEPADDHAKMLCLVGRYKKYITKYINDAEITESSRSSKTEDQTT